MSCPTCSQHCPPSVAPPEPPVGTWVRAAKVKPGATRPFVSYRQKDGWGEPGTCPFGKWEAMWEHWGPLVECAPWGL